MTDSFNEKKLRVVIRLADDSNTVFEGTGSNTLIIDSLRMHAKVMANARQAVQMVLSIWGMRTTDMDALTSAWIDSTAIRDNIVQLFADIGNGFFPVFSGTITEAQPDYQKAPEVSFQILATVPYIKMIDIAEPSSYQGSLDINEFGQFAASQLGMSFASSAQATLTDQYLSGSIFDQLRDACSAAKVDFYFQGDKLVFAPLQKPLSDSPVVVLTPSTGLLGYPMYTRFGTVINALYDPVFQCGSAIEVQDSQVKGINGRWYPFAAEYDLSANLPNGPWFATLQCNKTGT
jgi:hypothetical protein